MDNVEPEDDGDVIGVGVVTEPAKVVVGVVLDCVGVGVGVALDVDGVGVCPTVAAIPNPFFAVQHVLASAPIPQHHVPSEH